MRLISIALASALLLACAAAHVRAETRAVTLPTAFRPHGLNTIATSPSAPVAFVGSRDTDTVFAFDPRTGTGLGQLQVGDGPLHIEVLERGGGRLLAVACDGFVGDPKNSIALVDAADPANMRLVRRIDLPDGYGFV